MTDLWARVHHNFLLLPHWLLSSPPHSRWLARAARARWWKRCTTSSSRYILEPMTTSLKTVQQNPSPRSGVSLEQERSKLSSPEKRSPKKMRRRTCMETRSNSLSKNFYRTSTVGLWDGCAENLGWKMRLSWGTSMRRSWNGPFLSRTCGLSSTITSTALESRCGH